MRRLRPHRPRTLATIGVLGVVLAAFVAVGVVGLVRGPGDTAPATNPTPGSSQPTAAPRPPTAAPTPAVPLRTVDPVAYARSVAEIVFTWDTMSPLMPDDYASIVIADADPTGYETNGLVADLANYFPTEQAWQQLREYATTQSVTIHNADIPASWPDIAATAGDQLRPGTVAVTIDGTRHRSGTWQGRHQASDHRVSFTVFVACPPHELCHILRLSRPDSPLR